MIRALYSSATGMVSQQTNLDVISHNLANVNTTGFKKSKIEFQDLIYQTTKIPGSDVGGGNQIPTGIQIGHGSRVMATRDPRLHARSEGDLRSRGARVRRARAPMDDAARRAIGARIALVSSWIRSRPRRGRRTNLARPPPACEPRGLRGHG